jgi:hypothetical protein
MLLALFIIPVIAHASVITYDMLSIDYATKLNNQQKFIYYDEFNPNEKHIVWLDDYMLGGSFFAYHQNGTQSGNSWSLPHQIDNAGSPEECYYPAIEKVYNTDETRTDLFVSCDDLSNLFTSSDNGVNWAFDLTTSTYSFLKFTDLASFVQYDSDNDFLAIAGTDGSAQIRVQLYNVGNYYQNITLSDRATQVDIDAWNDGTTSNQTICIAYNSVSGTPAASIFVSCINSSNLETDFNNTSLWNTANISFSNINGDGAQDNRVSASFDENGLFHVSWIRTGVGLGTKHLFYNNFNPFTNTTQSPTDIAGCGSQTTICNYPDISVYNSTLMFIPYAFDNAPANDEELWAVNYSGSWSSVYNISDYNFLNYYPITPSNTELELLWEWIYTAPNISEPSLYNVMYNNESRLSPPEPAILNWTSDYLLITTSYNGSTSDNDTLNWYGSHGNFTNITENSGNGTALLSANPNQFTARTDTSESVQFTCDASGQSSGYYEVEFLATSPEDTDTILVGCIVPEDISECSTCEGMIYSGIFMLFLGIAIIFAYLSTKLDEDRIWLSMFFLFIAFITIIADLGILMNILEDYSMTSVNNIVVPYFYVFGMSMVFMIFLYFLKMFIDVFKALGDGSREYRRKRKR